MKGGEIMTNIVNILKEENGEGYIDVLVKILISVVIGSLLLGLLKTAMPEIFDSLIVQIKGLITE